MSNVRTIRQGSTAYIWANITEQNRADLSQTTFKVAIVAKDAQPSVWVDPSVTQRKSPSNVRLAATVDPSFTAGGYQLYVRAIDYPEDEMLYAGYFVVR